MYKLETILTFHIIILLPNLSAILGNYSFKPGGDALHQPLAQLIVTVDLLHILVMMVFSWGLFFGTLDFTISLTMDQLFSTGQISAMLGACSSYGILQAKAEQASKAAYAR